MAKRSRNKPAARERIARMRAEQARRRRRRIRLASGAAAATVIGVAAAIVLAVTGGSGAAGGATSGLSLAPLSTLGALRPAPAPGVTGPEGVPVPAAAPLAGTTTAATGQPVDQINCQTGEQTLFHIHAHLAIFVNGKAWQIPAAIGIPGAQAQQTPNGPYIATGSCFYWLHTHAADGIIHIESPVQRTYTLGDFFDEWGQPLGPAQAGPATGRVVALYRAGGDSNLPSTSRPRPRHASQMTNERKATMAVLHPHPPFDDLTYYPTSRWIRGMRGADTIV